MDELKPCPFCKGKTELQANSAVSGGYIAVHYGIGQCPLNRKYVHPTAWNTRTAPDDVVETAREQWPEGCCACATPPYDDEVVHDRNGSPRCPRCYVALGGSPMTASERSELAADFAGPLALQSRPADNAGLVGEVRVVFDGSPGPEGARFVECETPDGHSINAGEWVERADGLWELRILTALRSNHDEVVEK